MNYEIVELKEKTIVGFAGRTSNDDPKMGAVISGLWQSILMLLVCIRIMRKEAIR